MGTYREGVRGVVASEGGNGSAWEDGEEDKRASNVGFGHFWEMVWQEGVEVLIMLTRCVEEGREKCGVYYPGAVGDTLQLEGENDGWGAVTCESVKVENGTEIRELKVTRRKRKGLSQQDGEVDEEGDAVVETLEDEEVQDERKVWHFLFLGWPDQEVPQTAADQKALLEFIRMTRFRINAIIDNEPEQQSHLPTHLQTQPTPPSSSTVTPSNSLSNISPKPPSLHKPRIVHCSAGVGRTGTFIALDFLLQELEDGKLDHVTGKDDDPVLECVKRLREQRMLMVYKPAQFVFIYQVLRERWLSRMERLMGKGADGEEGSPSKKRKVLENESENEEADDVFD